MSTKNYFWLYIKIAIQAVLHVIVAEDGSRLNASGTDANTRDNPGIIELLSGPLPQNGEIRRLQFRE